MAEIMFMPLLVSLLFGIFIGVKMNEKYGKKVKCNACFGEV